MSSDQKKRVAMLKSIIAGSKARYSDGTTEYFSVQDVDWPAVVSLWLVVQNINPKDNSMPLPAGHIVFTLKKGE
jgi:hypothetical protein